MKNNQKAKNKLLNITNKDGTLNVGGLVNELVQMKKDIILLTSEVKILEAMIFGKEVKNEYR